MEENSKHKEIQDLDFKNLDPQQAEMLQKLIKVVACRTLKILEGLSGDKDKVLIYYHNPDTLTTNELINLVKALDPIGFEHMIGLMEATFAIEDIRHKAYLNSWKCRIKKWWKETKEGI